MKRIRLDLISKPAEELMKLSSMLDNILAGKTILDDVKIAPLVTSINGKEYIMKLIEMLGEKFEYEISSILTGVDKRYFSLAAEHIANSMCSDNVKISHHRRDTMHGYTWPVTRVENKNRRIEIEFNENGLITSSNIGAICWKNPMHYMACTIEEDIALVIVKDNKLIYADISRFEKTPKDVHTGVNNYVGLDLLKFHSNAKTYGSILPKILSDITECMRQDKLDLLTIDLRGNNLYTNGKDTIRRFETDKVLPIKSKGILEGIIVYADVKWQPADEIRIPCDGGRVINVGSEMHNEYRLVEHSTKQDNEQNAEKNNIERTKSAINPHTGGDKNGP